MENRPAGYLHLLKKFEIAAIPNWHTSFVSPTGSHRSKVQNNRIEEIYPSKYWPGENIGDHLEFALKYDGVNLILLKLIFEA